MTPQLLPVPMAFVAFLYAMVGHGGASGYLALMGLAQVPSTQMKMAALTMNLAVSAIAAAQYLYAGHFRWKLLRPFVLTSVPCAFVGAGVHLEEAVYMQLLGVCIAIAGLRLLGVFRERGPAQNAAPLVPGLVAGAVIGTLSGMLGIGGGVLLSPVLLLMGWADARSTSATSAFFILVNSAAGLLNLTGSPTHLPEGMAWWTAAAVAGGLAGSWVGARRAPEPGLRRVLGVVLLLASVKLIRP